MTVSFNSNMKFDFENLTNMNFNENVPLSFRFVTSEEVRVMTGRTSCRDVIRFAPLSDVVKKVEELAKKGFQLYCIPSRSYGCEVGYYDMPATQSRIFFEAIKQLQANKADICILKREFQNVLSALQEHQYISSVDTKEFESNIQTNLTLKEYTEETEKTRDAKKAISLAHYSIHTRKPLDHSPAASLYWLCEAKRYLGEQSLNELINLDEFLQNFKKIETTAPFRSEQWFRYDVEEIVEAIVRCPSIKELDLPPQTDYYPDVAEKIGSFLAKTTYIEKVTFKKTPFFDYKTKMINSQTVIPIADALRMNKSIKEFKISFANIGDEGVLKLLDAIESNPESKITLLDIRGCGMTDRSASKLVELLRKMKQLTVFSQDNNFSEPLAKELEQISKERQAESKGQ